MSYLATLAFDLTDSDAETHRAACADLEYLGFTCELVGATARPYGACCVGLFTGDSAEALRELLWEVITGVLTRRDAHARLTLSVAPVPARRRAPARRIAA